MNQFSRKLGSYAALTAADVATLDRATARCRRVQARKDLIREGDEPGPVFVVLEGWAFRYKILPNGSRQIMALLMPGDCCDLRIGMLAQMDHSIQTATPCRVATIGRAEMEEMLDQNRNIARAMYVSQLADEGTLRAWIVSIGRRSSIERVAHLICEIYLRAHRNGLVEAREFEMPLSQIVLADALGLTPVHLNRVLKELRLAGAMTLRRGAATIVDPGRLIQIAGFDENYLHRQLRRMV